MVPLGLASGGAVYLWSRRRGRNEVFAGGAADAAYGPASVSPCRPGHRCHRRRPPAERSTDQVRLVADDELADLATIEFVPPKGVDPWQGAVLLRERIDDETVGAWFSGLAARDVLAIERDGDDTAVLRRGAQLERARPEESAVLSDLFTDGEEISLGRYDKDFAKAWNRVRADQERSIAASGFWKRDAPRATRTRFSWTVLVVLFIWVIIGAGSILSAVFGVFSSPLGAIVFGIVVPGIVALRRLPDAPAGPLGHRVGPGAAHRVVPSLPRRQRRSPRRVGLEARAAARVLRMGGGARRGNGLGAGAGCLERPARRVHVRTTARLHDGTVVRQRAHRTVELRWVRWRLLRRRLLRRQRRWWRRRWQLRAAGEDVSLRNLRLLSELIEPAFGRHPVRRRSTGQAGSIAEAGGSGGASAPHTPRQTQQPLRNLRSLSELAELSPERGRVARPRRDPLPFSPESRGA